MMTTELLAPAGDLACGIAALDAGADAVYIGASRFGAREKASNSLEDIVSLCRHAHKFGARVYAAVNTVLYDSELEECRRLICGLYEAGADGIIIQDTAILEMDLPPVKLIASTQMNCGTADKIRFFYSAGIRRFILPRELSLGEIKTIRSNIPEDAELEAFIHGALCVARSGECYLSWSIGRRSGNRGCCAQPCRNRYILEDPSGAVLARGHLLSLKDLALPDYIAGLADCGVSSFKIEGRLKGADYVTNVTAYYRQILDRVIEQKGLLRSSEGIHIPDRDFVPDINKTFNRGFTEFMINGRIAGVSAMDTPSMKGELLGKVLKVRGKRVFLDRQVRLKSGDGIAFLVPEGLSGTNVNLQESPDSVTVNESRRIKPGTIIYRNLDSAWRKTLPVYARYVPVTVSVTEEEGGYVFCVRDRGGTGFRYSEVLPPADNGPRALETLKKQLAKKSPDSCLLCREVSCDIRQTPFVPIGHLNEIRRLLFRGLEDLREVRPRRRETALRKEARSPESLDYRANITNRLAREFYSKRGAKSLEPAPEAGTDLAGRQVMECAYCLRRELGLCHADKSRNEPLFLRNPDIKLRAEFDCKSCTMRLYAAGTRRHTGK
ncbi:MAG: U32 family peptidase [Abditibacteriota bacterium]|nr:U32 family peptidase [Abditibacteriota bacterium]